MSYRSLSLLRVRADYVDQLTVDRYDRSELLRVRVDCVDQLTVDRRGPPGDGVLKSLLCRSTDCGSIRSTGANESKS